MTQIASTKSVQARFHDVVLTNNETRFTLRQSGDEFWVRMERMADPAAGSPAVEALAVRIGLVTGSHHMQVFWAPGDEGNTQLGFPFTWLIPEQRWVPRHSTFIRPPDTVHRSEIWNVVCSRCHATGVEPRVDALRHTVDTRAAELGISCEACHGPGQRHTEARSRAPDQSVTPEAQVLAGEIVQPRKLAPARGSQVCGFCHSMKWIDRAETWRQNGFRYRPGDDLEQTTPIIQPARVAAIPGLAAFLARNPDLLADYFWPDGMVRVSGREYNGLIESPCYRGGTFSCFSCHSLHESDPNDQLARSRQGNGACTQCHEEFSETARLIVHTRHRPGSTGSECYNCHMPHTTYGVLSAIRSHQISSPRLADEVATGRPNACNLCHLDRSLAWTAEQLTAWRQHPRPELPADASAVPWAVRLALAGDAGQRALIAWHLGWAPAGQASGTNWLAPVLGQLLDDPYAAVRCVAQRSLDSISRLTPPGYDYVTDPRSRPPARDAVWAAWQREWSLSGEAFSTNRSLLARPDDLAAQARAFDGWVRQRDNRPMRLRE
jgi:predicted CXXCH cytochrome family protein